MFNWCVHTNYCATLDIVEPYSKFGCCRWWRITAAWAYVYKYVSGNKQSARSWTFLSRSMPLWKECELFLVLLKWNGTTCLQECSLLHTLLKRRHCFNHAIRLGHRRLRVVWTAPSHSRFPYEVRLVNLCFVTIRKCLLHGDIFRGFEVLPGRTWVSPTKISPEGYSAKGHLICSCLQARLIESCLGELLRCSCSLTGEQI